MKEYYDARAQEYDDWYLGTGLFASRERPGWDEALRDLLGTLSALPPARTLDVACGTGFLTRHLPGAITGLDQSERMLAVAREQVPHVRFVHGDGLSLPFAAEAFERVFTGHFYGHLQAGEREQFLSEARRVAPELVLVDSALRPDHQPVEWQERTLNDGARFTLYKRYFDPRELAEELGGGRVLHGSGWFVTVISP